MRWDQDVYNKAWKFATIYHHGQSYGGAEEGEQIAYLNHIGSVAMEVLWALQDDVEANANLALQCALLHDTLEDTAASYDLLQQHFGTAVADGVAALSKNGQLEKAQQMADSLARIALQPREVGMVKLADRITNLIHPPYYWNNQKILAYRDEAMQIEQALGHCNAALQTRLRQKIADYPQFLRPQA